MFSLLLPSLFFCSKYLLVMSCFWLFFLKTFPMLYWAHVSCFCFILSKPSNGWSYICLKYLMFFFFHLPVLQIWLFLYHFHSICMFSDQLYLEIKFSRRLGFTSKLRILSATQRSSSKLLWFLNIAFGQCFNKFVEYNRKGLVLK